MQKTKHVTFVLLMLVALSVTGCSSDSNSVTGALKSTDTLTGKTWVLQSYGPQGNPQPVLKGSEVTALGYQGQWVQVDVAERGRGWIHYSLLATTWD